MKEANVSDAERLMVAALILAGFGAGGNPTSDLAPEILAKCAYDRADALIEEHKKRINEP